MTFRAFGHAARIQVDRFDGIEGLRCAARVVKTLKPQPSTCELSIWGLSPGTRKALEELRTKPGARPGIPVVIEAGYDGRPLSQIWLGDLRTAISQRDPPSWVTRISSGDGEKAYKEARINEAFGPGTPVAAAMRAVINRIREYSAGGVPDPRLEELARAVTLRGGGKLLTGGLVLSGSAIRALTMICQSAGLEWSFQDGQIQILDRGKALRTSAIEVKDGTNLRGNVDVDAEGVIKIRLAIGTDARPGASLQVDTERAQGLYRIEKTTTVLDTWSVSEWYVDVEGKRLG